MERLYVIGLWRFERPLSGLTRQPSLKAMLLTSWLKNLGASSPRPTRARIATNPLKLDIPDLLEFANAQLLELRVYDDLADRELDVINNRMIMQASPSIWKIKRYEELAARVMRTVMDLTGITEKIDNSIKVTEDVYYARVYSSALSLFKVHQWETSIDRKMLIASRSYDMLYREISNKRTEFLELIIIILIALEIVLFLVVKI